MVIDTFLDTEYYKSQHQIESFDEFIFSEENGIQKIIKINPYALFKGRIKRKNSLIMNYNLIIQMSTFKQN